MRRVRFVFVTLGIIIAATLAALLMFEAYTRFDVRSKLNAAEPKIIMRNLEPGRTTWPDPFDREFEYHPVGYYKLNQAVETLIVQGKNQHLGAVRINNLGFLSDKTYEFERDAANPEFRIVVLGDSFTGTTTGTYQWVDTIEDLLNGNGALREAVGDKTFRTYNLGLPGGSVAHMTWALETIGTKFAPDLVVLNYIEADFYRTFEGPHLTSDEETIDQAIQQFEKLKTLHDNVLVTHHPVRDDLDKTVKDHKISQAALAGVPGLDITFMQERLPIPVDGAQRDALFNLPLDSHMSDLGGEVYARGIASLIADKVFDLDIDFSDVASKYHPDRTGNAPKPLSKIGEFVEDPALMESLLDLMADAQTGKANAALTSGYLFSHARLTGRFDGFSPPLHLPVKSYFQAIEIPGASFPTAYVYVLCASEPHRISNPECLSLNHVWVP